MYVCHCRAVTDRAIRAAVSSGAHTVEEVGLACDAGTRCGSCHPEIQRLLAERSADLRSRERVAV